MNEQELEEGTKFKFDEESMVVWEVIRIEEAGCLIEVIRGPIPGKRFEKWDTLVNLVICDESD